MRAVLQNQDTLVFRLKSSRDSGFSSKPPNSGRLATLLGFWGAPGICSFREKKLQNLRFSNCWKCTEIINPTITNVIFVSFKILYDPIRRTFLAPGGRRAHPAPPPPRAYGPGQPLTRSNGARFLSYKRSIKLTRL